MSIDITVNENIEIVDIVAVPNVQNVNITQQNNVENIEIITQPNVYEVNITRVIGGGAVDSVNGQTGDVVLNAGDVGAYTTGEVDTLLLDKFDNPTGDNTQYLDGAGTPTTFPTIPAAQVNSDWNATSGVAEILNKPTIPSVTNLVPYTGATQNVDLGEYQIKAGQIELDQTPTGTAGVAVTRWNDSTGSTETTLKGGTVVLKNGVDLVARVVNKVTPNTTLTKAAYQAVRVTGAQGQRLAVAFAQANNDNNSADTIGLVCETIATNQEGFILTVGQLEDINTTGALQGETWSDGDVLYLSPTTAGRLTNVKPSGATGHIVVIGYVEYSHAIHGKIYVKVMNGWELDELHNVSISSPTNNQILAYTSASQLWENKSVATALGFTPENVANKQTNLTASATNYPTVDAVNTGLGTKQNTLVSGTNIKTLEGLNTLGSGDLEYLNNTMFEQNIGYMIPNVGQTTYSILRSTGALSQFAQAGDFSNPSRMLYATGTTTGSLTAQRGTAGGNFSLVSSLKFYFKRRFQIDSNVSGSRFVCGLSNQFGTVGPTNVEPDTLINTLGVCKLSTSNNLYFFWNDATGLATTIDLGVNYPANNVTAYTYDLEIFKDSGSANITLKLTRIDASGNRISTSQVISSNYNTGVFHYPVIYALNNTTAASFRFFDYGVIFKNYNSQWNTI